MTSDTNQSRNHDYLRIVIDDGSGRLKVAGQHVPAGATPSKLEVDVVCMQAGCSTLDQKFLIAKDSRGQSRLLQGDIEVTNWVNNHPEYEHSVIEGHKLVLFDEYKDLPASRGFFQAIESRHGDMGNVQEFTALRYKIIRDGVISFYKDHSAKGLDRDREYWDNIAIEVMITVPALWGAQACSILKSAAADAGFSSINLRLEPLCAAALNMQKHIEAGRIQHGVILAFCDTGHLTNDRAAVKYSLDAGQSPRLEIVGKPHGDVYGSHYVNRIACNYARSCDEVLQQGGLEEVLRRLGGLPTEAFDRQVSNAIDLLKKNPTQFTISVTGTEAHRQVDQGIAYFNIRITRHRMAHFLDQWATKVVESDKQWLSSSMFHNHSGPIISGLIITGGGGRDRTLQQARMSQLKHLVKKGVYHDQVERDHEVAEGGLRRYPSNLTSKLPYGHFYLERAEPAGSKGRKPTKNASKRRQPGEDDGDHFIKKGFLILKRVPDEPIMTKCIEMRFEVDRDFNVTLEFFLYYSQSLFDDGVVLHDQAGKLRSEFFLLDVPFAFPDVDWDKYKGRARMFGREGRLCDEITGLVRMEVSEDHLDLVVTLIEPGERLQYDSHGNPKTNVKYRTIAEIKREIWDTARTSHIPDDMRPIARSTASEPLREAQSPLCRRAAANAGTRRSTRSAAIDATRKRKAAEMQAFDSDYDDEETLPRPPSTMNKAKHVDDDEIIVSPPRHHKHTMRGAGGKFISKKRKDPSPEL